MAISLSKTNELSQDDKGKNYTVPLILVTSLFFLWGLAYGLLDVLNKHFQEVLSVGKAQSTLLQAAYFGAYFSISLPAGLFMKKYGYKRGIIFGLLLYALGAFLFYPAAAQLSFNFFLISLFILAAGLTFLETAANPYIAVLGDPKTSEYRLNLSQSFNGVGGFLGPLIGASLFFNEGEEAGNDLSSVQTVYLIISGIVLLITIFFGRTSMPKIQESDLVSTNSQDSKPLFKHGNFTGSVIAQFFYVAAQVGIAALFINYCTEAGLDISNKSAAKLLSVSMILFTVGRFVGTALMKKVAANKLLLLYALISIFLCALVVWIKGYVSIYALMALFFFESIMFPTIFALGIKDLGRHTRQGASFIIMSIAGGAFVPFLMGKLAESGGGGTAFGYIIPLFCFIIVAWYGWHGYKAK